MGIMETEVNQFKYERHSKKQYSMILSVAERLFIDNGIEKVSLTDIANECGIVRSTFYRYFTNKDEIIWSIIHNNAVLVFQKIHSSLKQEKKTTFERFETILNILYEDYLQNPKKYVFIDMTYDDYQNVTSEKNNAVYNRFFNEEEFRSGDTVNLLVENFHDGSVKPDLDPHMSAVSILYAATGILTSMSRQIDTLPMKYGVKTEDVVRISLNALLESIKVDKNQFEII
jgi:Transcriptional regulator